MGRVPARSPGILYSRSRFYERYLELRQRLRRSMRQIYVAGEKLFVDYAGPTVPIIDPASGEISRAHILWRLGRVELYLRRGPRE